MDTWELTINHIHISYSMLLINPFPNYNDDLIKHRRNQSTDSEGIITHPTRGWTPPPKKKKKKKNHGMYLLIHALVYDNLC